jgi:outer membrane protein OmpA-like peptidoglycan-associated protein
MLRLLLLLFFTTIFLSAKEVVISFDKPYVYNKRLTKKNVNIPKNPVIPTIKGFEIHRAQYKNFYKLTLGYLLDDETKVQERYEGKYWLVSQKSKTKIKGSKEKRIAARDDLLRSYKKSMENAGAKFYKSRINPDMRMVFNLDNIWGVIAAYPDNFEIQAVEIEGFKQSLKIDPDKLLAELQKNGEVKLDGIYFDTGKATLKKQSKPALLAAATLMKKYPTLILEIQGHTDSVGSDEANLMLSQNRAKSVKNALVELGVETKRLKAKGYGEKAPIATNDTDEGRAHNRRVVLKKLSGGNEKAIITIDFMKPMPGFKVALIRGYANEKMNFRFNQKGHKGHEYIYGNEVRAEYETIDKKNRNYSYLEILKNYEGVLTSLGAEILGKDFPGAQNLYFRINDRGDGKKIYGVVKAYNSGNYTISFLTPNK